MSQYIQKFQEGGSPQLFTYPAGQIETSRMVQAISVNLDKYLSDKNWSRSRKERFVNSVNKFISGIESGSINAMSPTGTFKDSRGAIEGVSDLNGTRRFREDKEAAKFVKWVLDSQIPYKEPEKEEEPKPEPLNLRKRFVQDFNRNVFSSNADYIDSDNIINGEFTPETLGTAVFNVLDKITTDNWGDIFQNQENYTSKVAQAKQAFDSNQTFKGLKSALIKLGLDTSFIPDNAPVDPTATKKEYNYQDIVNKAYSGEDVNSYEIKLDNSATAFKSKVFEWNIVPATLANPQQDISNLLRNMSWSTANEMNQDSGIQWHDQRGVFTKQLTYSQLLNQLIPYITNPQRIDNYMKKLKDNVYLITATLNPANSKHVLIYNKTDNKVWKVGLKSLYGEYDFIDKAVRDYIDQRLKNTNVSQQKNGGTIKKYQDPDGPLWGPNFDLFERANDYIEWDTKNRFKITSSDGQKFQLEKRIGKVTDDNKNNLYAIEPYGKEIQNLNWYKGFQNVLNTNEELAKTWATGYKTHNPEDIADVSKPWLNDAGQFDFGQFKQRAVNNDDANGPGHDVFKGVRYYDKANKTWVKVADLKDYEVTEDSWTDDNNPLISVKYVKRRNNGVTPTAETEAETGGKEKETGGSSVTGSLEGKKPFLNMSNIRRILPYLGETQRWLATAASNKEIYDKSLINPLYTSAPHFEINQYRDLGAEIQGQQQAGTVHALASQPLTSDASLTANQQLDANKLANQYIQQGLATSTKKAEETGLRAALQSKENELKAVDNANANAKAKYTADVYNQQQELGYLQKKWNNNDTYSKAMQNLLQGDMDERTALVEQQLKQYLTNRYDYTQDPEYIALQNELQDHIRSGKSSATFDKTKLQRMAEIKRQSSEKLATEMIAQIANLRGYSNINQYIPDDLKKAIGVPQSKNGGVLLASGGRISDEARIKIAKIKDELERQKLFQKSIEHSIKVNDKKLDQLSNTMQKLLMNMVK